MIKLHDKIKICPHCKHENHEVEEVTMNANGIWTKCNKCGTAMMLGTIVKWKGKEDGSVN